jgi:hypothetical protein
MDHTLDVEEPLLLVDILLWRWQTPNHHSQSIEGIDVSDALGQNIPHKLEILVLLLDSH